MNLKDRMLRAGPIWGRIVKRRDSFIRLFPVAGSTAGSFAITGIKAGDKLISVIEVTTSSAALVDRTAEFGGNGKIIDADGVIDNTGGTDTSTDALLVLWEAYEER